MDLAAVLKALPLEEVGKALEAAGLTAGVLYPAQALDKKYSGLGQIAGVQALPEPAKALFTNTFHKTVEAQASEEDAYRRAWTAVRSEYAQKSDGSWTAKSVQGLPEPSLGKMTGELDNLRRQLITDGYSPVADLMTGTPETDMAAFNFLPQGYRETIQGRYENAHKAVTPLPEAGDAQEFTVMAAFKALLPEQRISYGVVYPVDEVDLQGEWARREVVEKAAHKFMEDWRQQDTFHTEKSGAGQPVESFLAPCDITEFHGVTLKEPIKKGSWVMATRWTPDAWELVKSGQIRGYSIGGFKRLGR